MTGTTHIKVDVGGDAVLECKVNNLGDYHVRSVSRLVTSDIGDAYVVFDVEDGDAVDDGPLHRWALLMENGKFCLQQQL